MRIDFLLGSKNKEWKQKALLKNTLKSLEYFFSLAE